MDEPELGKAQGWDGRDVDLWIRIMSSRCLTLDGRIWIERDLVIELIKAAAAMRHAVSHERLVERIEALEKKVTP